MNLGFPLLPIALVLLFTLAPATAEACACCDGALERSPVAWSEAGDQILVHHVGRGCISHKAVELWRAGEGTPSACYDLLGDPTIQVPCGELTNHIMAPALTPLPISEFVLPPGFSLRAAPSPHPVRIEVRRDRTGVDPATHTRLRGVGVVELEWEGSWVPLYEGPVTRSDWYHPMPVHVAMWASPDGRRALLTIHNNYSGEDWVTSMVWVDLPPAAAP